MSEWRYKEDDGKVLGSSSTKKWGWCVQAFFLGLYRARESIALLLQQGTRNGFKKIHVCVCIYTYIRVIVHCRVVYYLHSLSLSLSLSENSKAKQGKKPLFFFSLFSGCRVLNIYLIEALASYNKGERRA